MKPTEKEHMNLDELNKDIALTRGAMHEILEHNRLINRDILKTFVKQDFSLLEEYTATTKNILDAAKLLTEMNAQAPKTIKSLSEVQVEEKVDIASLMDD